MRVCRMAFRSALDGRMRYDDLLNEKERRMKNSSNPFGHPSNNGPDLADIEKEIAALEEEFGEDLISKRQIAPTRPGAEPYDWQGGGARGDAEGNTPHLLSVNESMARPMDRLPDGIQ